MAVDPGAIRRGSVVVVRMPGDKARPAVVVRSDVFAELAYATILPITSERREGIGLRIDLAPTADNGLKSPSQVMADWPQTIRLSAMGEVIGRLDPATMRAIAQRLAMLLGFGPGEGGAGRGTARS